MPKFAVYYIPPAESALYQSGSALLAYDIRAQQVLDAPLDLLPDFDPAWVGLCQQYGFHVTTAGTFEFDPANLDAVIDACRAVMNSFDPANPWFLHPQGVQLWGEKDPVVLIGCEANSHFQTLHTALCAYLPQFGTGSRNFERLQANPRYRAEQPQLHHRIRHFYTAHIFDSFLPHFTLLNPYTGPDRSGLQTRLNDLFHQLGEVQIDSLCLVMQPEAEAFYEIVCEFHRADFPQSIP